MSAIYLAANLVVLLLAVGLGMTRGRRLGPGAISIKETWHLLALVPILLALLMVGPFLDTRPLLQWDMPFWLQLHYQAASLGTVVAILAYVFSFTAANYFGAQRPTRWTVLAGGVAVLLAVHFYAWHHLSVQPIPPGPPRITADGIILQSNGSTCVAASAANIANRLGVKVSERELIKLCGTTRDGTLPAQVARGMGTLGFATRRKSIPDARIESLKPNSMLFIAGDTHAVAFMGMTNGLAEIWDPAIGRKLLPPALIARLWTGHALEFTFAKRP
jgi:hypothetical protein